MDIQEAILARHSVRQYKNEPIEESVKEKLESIILKWQVVINADKCAKTLR